MDDITKLAPEVSVQVGEKTYQFKCTFGFLQRFQKCSGKNPFRAETFLEPTPDDMVALIWAGVVVSEPNVTPEEIGERLTLPQALQCRAILGKFFANATTSETPDDQKKKDEKTEPEAIKS